ncbi:MAG: hypothetical protein WB995_19870 [Candidatus Acidiferrales bacterium]
MRPSTLHAPEGPQVQLKMPDALRSVNVNEIKLAKTYRRLLNRRKATEKTPDAKLLLDTVRDCARILEPLREAEGVPENAVIQLVHNVARPDREAEPDAPVGEGL